MASPVRIGTCSRLLIGLITIVAFGSAQDNYLSNGKQSWSIAYGHDWGAHEYFDKKGYIQGFSKEIIEAVCAAGNMNCYTVWAPYTQCWTSKPGEHPYGGPGLMDGWYDACTGWVPTTDRIHTMNFGMAYLKETYAHFYIKKGASFDPSDLQNKKIGFLTGWFADEKCLARAESSDRRNYLLSKDQIIYRDNPEQLIPLLTDGSIQAIAAALDTTEKYFENIEEVPGVDLRCAQGGNSMMTRKDSKFLDAWNRGFQKLRSSGGYAKLCEKARQNHEIHGQINCVD